MKYVLLGSIASVGALSVAAVAQQPGGPAHAELRKADGHAVGHARAEQHGDAVRVHIEATGLQPGNYGAHVHMTGRCDPPDFSTAGAHWNPMGRQHGKENPQGPHMGDLPNLTVGANGVGTLSFEIPHATLRGGEHQVLDGDGASVIIHASPDDYHTDPSGNSGARVICGVLN